MIIIHATFHVKPDKREVFLSEIQPLLAGSQAEEGNVYYDLYEHTENKNVFIMVEAWRDSEAVDIHNATPHFTGFVGKAEEFLAAPLDVKVYNAEQA
ncbi:quinol monooxygenase YgiN [Paenibacillus forsythiae]|uniref:Quinol monooxygenase YgiN n=1 Tax=Paenibacillus forsythiae TaxID=365616 RepID=A0ABU3HDA0_9BACL|nr:putative quinol monooxygenase [Paenibacillus forsythiae]MDT3428720.1 quinol monooxygenase YgiN [Paenibacillus forsythiae]